MMKAWILLVSSLFMFTGAMAQAVADDDPVYVLDSVVVTQAVVGQVSPDRIGLMTIAKGSKAVLKYGSQAENGVVYIETKPFARKRVQTLLRSKSPQYDSLLNKYGNDSSFLYVVNGHPMEPTNETLFMTLDQKTFRSINILTREQIVKSFGEAKHEAVIVITSSEE
ncbi:MAG: hypothetical protein J7623_15550 [Chitinophaga sp.]|uniref:hypothetical protein n=1 Tax=Chitinophaga sp. TaxID=1869181 RepID=UPI001AFF0C3F|nr:hypothetical protein [Chitinophaga sp.]MBO9730052.1 hypothetical protein [Chitinophaga sp.]